jgi:hypothetical protein
VKVIPRREFISLDEARQSIGLDPLGGAFATPMALTANGYVAIKSPEEQDAAAQAQQQAASDAAAARMGHNGGPQMDEHGGGDEGSTQGKDQKAPAKGKKPEAADKMLKGLKKKPNPYLLTTDHRHGSHELA